MGITAFLRGQTAEVGEGRRSVHASVLPTDPITHRHLLALAGASASSLTRQVGRSDAMAVPALASGVAILTGISAQLPLVAEPSEQPRSLLEELDPRMPRGWTVAKTVDDLIFHAQAWWYVTSRDAQGFPRTVERVGPERLWVDEKAGRIKIDGVEVNTDDVKRFDGLTEGILQTGREAIGLALANVRQARTYAENPQPQMILTDEDGAEALEPDEARRYIEAFSETMRTRGVGYLAGFKINNYGWNATDIQLIPARQHDAIEMARLLSIPAHYLQAPPGGSSLTYTTLPEIRRDLIEIGGLAQYLVPIEQRLSMPDITPRGTTVKFDAESYFLQVTPDADPTLVQEARRPRPEVTQ